MYVSFWILLPCRRAYGRIFIEGEYIPDAHWCCILYRGYIRMDRKRLVYLELLAAVNSSHLNTAATNIP